MALSLDGTTGISASGNIIGNNISVSGSLTVGSFSPASFSSAGNVTGGNVLTGGFVTATGNVTGGNVLTGGFVTATGNVTGGNLLTAGSISATGNATVGNLNTSGSISATGNATVGNLNTSGSISASGNITGLNINSSNADLAEMYLADQNYAPGTVVEFGGSHEITISKESHTTRVAGVVSTAPSYLMNSSLSSDHALEIALIGRVPCRVIGTIVKGDRLVSSTTPGVATALDPSQYQPGCIIGKALEAYNSSAVGTIEVVVGRV